MIIPRRKRLYENRPVIKTEMTPVSWILEFLALAGILAIVGVLAYYFPRLPDIVPSHFNGAGEPDEWSTKSSIWALPAAGLFVYILLTIIMFFPHRFNFPVKITPENAKRQYTYALLMIRYLKATLVWLFFLLTLTTVRVAMKITDGLGEWFLPVFLGLTFLPVILYILFVRRRV
jgi:uncharacterized membrane protein